VVVIIAVPPHGGGRAGPRRPVLPVSGWAAARAAAAAPRWARENQVGEGAAVEVIVVAGVVGEAAGARATQAGAAAPAASATPRRLEHAYGWDRDDEGVGRPHDVLGGGGERGWLIDRGRGWLVDRGRGWLVDHGRGRQLRGDAHTVGFGRGRGWDEVHVAGGWVRNGCEGTRVCGRKDGLRLKGRHLLRFGSICTRTGASSLA